MKRKHRRITICLAIALLPVIGWLVYRAFWPKLYRVIILPSLGGNATVPRAINDRGEIVGLAQDPNNDWHLVLWDQTRKVHDLGVLDPNEGSQCDINNRGQIAGYMTDHSGNRRAFLRDPNGSMRRLDPCDGGVFYAGLLNNQGQIAGKRKAADGSEHLCRWDRVNGLRDLNAVVTQDLYIAAINDKGQILGRDCAVGAPIPTFLWDPNDGVTAIDMDIRDLNNHSCVVGWRYYRRDGRQYMVSWQKDRGLTKLFDGESGRFERAFANDANQVLCGLRLRSRWERFSAKLFRPWDTHILWDPNKGRVFLERQLPWGLKGEFWPAGLNNHGCIVAIMVDEDHNRGCGIVMEPIPKRWRK